MDQSAIFIVGANGQLGSELLARYPGAQSADIDQLDIADVQSVQNFNWSGIRYLINAAAYTNVDGAETPDGRIAAWNVNASAVRNLAQAAISNDMTLVHISTDYVFDGATTNHSETEQFAPLSVYGQSKAAGDIVASVVPKHYILRTSWVIGNGNNFVRTMLGLGARGINPSVVSDQIGRLTFTKELVTIIDHLLATDSAFGTYNATNGGQSTSWAEIARQIYSTAGLANTVTSVTTDEYYSDKQGIAPRPLQSTLDLKKLSDSGYMPTDWQVALTEYIQKELR